MTSNDVRDMLDLPSAGAMGPRPKKAKTTAPKSTLRGLAREVAGLGGNNPIAIVPEATQFKKRRFANRKPAARWEATPFTNSARSDGLVLKHWRRKAESAPAPQERGHQADTDAMALDGDGTFTASKYEDSPFAKFAVKVNMPRYTDEVYEEHLKSELWTKHETDYLMEVVQDFDLRWPLIWDRYDYMPPVPQNGAVEGVVVQQARQRSLEELKARYYFVAAKAMAINKPIQFMAQAEFDLHEKMMHFSASQETTRKTYAEAMFTRTRDEASEEQSLLLELKRILARMDRLNEERRELYATLDAPPSTSNVGIFTSSSGLQNLFQQLMSVDKNRKKKSLMAPEVSSLAVNTPNPSSDNRRESGQRQESNASAATTTAAPSNKKGSVVSTSGPAERRTLTAEQETIYGVSHPERTTSGPYFRSERIAKGLLGRSASQQGKILNVLTELGIPPRLNMPTEDVGKSYEALVHAINQMLDLKKTADKLGAEMEMLKEANNIRAGNKQGATSTAGDTNGTAEANTAAPVKVEVGAADEVAGVPAGDEAEVAPTAGAASRAGSVRKRSASVLSVGSQHSTTKRQKK